ncbi:S8 family peptidase [Longimicrobium sp.]|uniref:S8 family peptidase n=1 Tax=Longimicrobium sp. TaxID=2029185 RepID=UPI003B3BD100
MKPIRFALPVLALAALAACADQPSPVAGTPADVAPLHSAAAGRGIPGEYVVVLNEGANPAAVAAVAGVRPQQAWTAALTGFAARLSPGQVTALRHHPDVAYVEQNQVTEPQWVQSPAPWGLDRIDQTNLPLNNQYVYNSLGQNVIAYIIDSGILTGHPEFGGRAGVVYDAFGGTGQDCHGHGTGVAGVVGSKTYGVAKGVRLAAVRVLNCSGVGTTAGLIGGINFVASSHPAMSVANISISNPLSAAVNTAVNNLFASGVYVAVAAGNNSANACNFSPGAVPAITTVTASHQGDQHVLGSNVGSCVDLYAPGRNIPTVGLTSTPVIANGTSIAAPHVTGTAALVWATFGGTPTTVQSWILTNATPGVLGGVPPGTPNRLLFKAAL